MCLKISIAPSEHSIRVENKISILRSKLLLILQKGIEQNPDDDAHHHTDGRIQSAGQLEYNVSRDGTDQGYDTDPELGFHGGVSLIIQTLLELLDSLA